MVESTSTMFGWIELYRNKYRNDPFMVEILDIDLEMLKQGPAAISYADDKTGQPGQRIREILRQNIWRRIEVGEK